MNVEIYTKLLCPNCERSKELLRIKGVSFVEHCIDRDPDRREEMRQRGAPYPPGIFIAGRLVGSCRELFDLDESGALDRLLGP